MLLAAWVAVALKLRTERAQLRVRLGLEVGRVGRAAPVGRLDRPPAIGRDGELGPLVVQGTPELPPRGGAAVAEVEVDRRGDAEKPGSAHERLSVAGSRYVAVRSAGCASRDPRRPGGRAVSRIT